MKKFIAIDIGGSKINFALLSETGEIYHNYIYKGYQYSENDVIVSIDQYFKTIQKEFKIQNWQEFLFAAGVTIPGLADSDKGIWLETSFSGIRNFPIVEKLMKKYNIPFFIENDCKACALAEKDFGLAKDLNSYIWITVSNGIGAAIVVNNKIFKGGNNFSGEIGHTIIQPKGRLCDCGQRGHLEAYMSGRALVNQFNEKSATQINNGLELANLARSNNVIAKEVFNTNAYLLGVSTANMINLFNINHVFFGGGIGQAFDIFNDSLTKGVEESIFKLANPEFYLLQSGIGYNAGLYGALSLAVRGFKSKKH